MEEIIAQYNITLRRGLLSHTYKCDTSDVNKKVIGFLNSAKNNIKRVNITLINEAKV